MGYQAESILFAVDVDAEGMLEATAGASRLDLLKQSVQLIAQTKAGLNPASRFGLATCTAHAVWRTAGCVPLESLLNSLASVKATEQSYESFNLVSLAELAAGVEATEAARGASVRAILLYCRSCAVPQLDMQAGAVPALAVDAVYMHERPVPGVNSPQEIYDALERHLDAMSRMAGHEAYIFEAIAGNVRRFMQSMVACMVHPSQRQPQQAMMTRMLQLLDIAKLPYQPVPGAQRQPPTATAVTTQPSHNQLRTSQNGQASAVASHMGTQPAQQYHPQSQQQQVQLLQQQQSSPQHSAQHLPLPADRGQPAGNWTTPLQQAPTTGVAIAQASAHPGQGQWACESKPQLAGIGGCDAGQPHGSITAQPGMFAGLVLSPAEGAGNGGHGQSKGCGPAQMHQAYANAGVTGQQGRQGWPQRAHAPQVVAAAGQQVGQQGGHSQGWDSLPHAGIAAGPGQGPQCLSHGISPNAEGVGYQHTPVQMHGQPKAPEHSPRLPVLHPASFPASAPDQGCRG